VSQMDWCGGRHTFFLANIFKGERQTCIFPLDDANLSEGTFSDHAKEAEVVEVDWRQSASCTFQATRNTRPTCITAIHGLSLGISHCDGAKGGLKYSMFN
jgi:hypothetical protein